MVHDLDPKISEVGSAASRLLGLGVSRVEQLGGGRNSRVYKLSCQDSKQYIGKLYFHSDADPRDRLEVEFSSLNYLWGNGIRCVPQPISADEEFGLAIYQYFEGAAITPAHVTESDIDSAVEFLARLNELATSGSGGAFAPASEACFSAFDLLENIRFRLDKLVRLRIGGRQYIALDQFLERELSPAMEAMIPWVESRMAQTGMPIDQALPLPYRTLSPSDFGFHNALKLEDGRIIFLDFEYFGWDDPAKMVCDFLLHPAMRLSHNHKTRFAGNIVAHMADDERLAARVETFYPLFGLKWCLILLNEFIPEHMMRRGFSNTARVDKSQLLVDQLAKARIMLQFILNEYQHFPYYE